MVAFPEGEFKLSDYKISFEINIRGEYHYRLQVLGRFVCSAKAYKSRSSAKAAAELFAKRLWEKKI